MPWLPPGRVVSLPGRGEVFVRQHQHEDASRPTVLLLHGWTASADLQFFTAYEELAAWCSFVGVDHCGHGRGIRTTQRFELEDVADDAASVLRALGIGPVIAVGYSMGGPIAMLLARRHPDLVAGLVVQATALEWHESRFERARWKLVHLMGPLLRSWAYQRSLRFGMRRLLGASHSLSAYVPWILSETSRGDSHEIVQAGRALARYNASPWARQLRVPAAMLLTTNDHLVLPRKQRALAAALDAHIVEVAGDHLVTWEHPTEFSRLTVELVRHVAARI